MTITSLPIYVSQEQLAVLRQVAEKGLSGLSIVNDSPLAAAELALLCMSIAESGGNAQLVTLPIEDDATLKPVNTGSNVVPFQR